MSIRIAEFLGWKAQPNSVAIGFKSVDGEDLSLSLSVEAAERTIALIAAAVGQSKAMTGETAPATGVTYEFAMKVSGAAFGTTPGTDDVFARLHLGSGGSLGFSMDRELARSFAEGLIDTVRAEPPKLLLH